MKSIDEIESDTRIQNVFPFPHGHQGFLSLRCGKRQVFAFVATRDDDGHGGIYEHVSVSVANSNTKTPPWEEMCEVKDIFWHETEEVHEVHPAKGDYIHGVGNLKNVLHLWRPANGWKW